MQCWGCNHNLFQQIMFVYIHILFSITTCHLFKNCRWCNLYQRYVCEPISKGCVCPRRPNWNEIHSSLESDWIPHLYGSCNLRLHTWLRPLAPDQEETFQWCDLHNSKVGASQHLSFLHLHFLHQLVTVQKPQKFQSGHQGDANGRNFTHHVAVCVASWWSC